MAKRSVSGGGNTPSDVVTLKGAVSDFVRWGLRGVTGSASVNLQGSSSRAVSLLAPLGSTPVSATINVSGAADSVAVPLRRSISAAVNKGISVAVSAPGAGIRGSNASAVVSRIAELTGNVSVTMRLRGDAVGAASVISKLRGGNAALSATVDLKGK